MNYFHCFIVLLFCCALRAERSATPVLIYNNHAITQTVATSNEPHQLPHSTNRFPGHTKPEHISRLSQPAIIIDNNHTIHQQSKHTTVQPTQQYNGTIASPSIHPSPLSWIAWCMPPCLLQLSGLQWCLGIMSASYLITLGQLLYRSSITLTQSDGWASWNSTVTLDGIQKNEKQYAQELFTALQARYSNAPNIAHCLTPLVHFINDVTSEIVALTSFIAVHHTIDSLKLTYLFPAHDVALALAREKIARAEYYKTLMVNWIGEYKA